MSLGIDRAAAEFTPDGAYLDTATVGVPPRGAVDALVSATADWARGRCDPLAYDGFVERSRRAFARLVGAPVEWIAVGAVVSPFVGLVAAALPDGATVLAIEGEFTSVLFPFLAHADRGVTVRCVPFDALADEIDDHVDLVAVSHVQSADGRVTDLDTLTAAAQRHGCATLVDATQSAGWNRLDATRIDYLVVGAYKWLLSPRGTAFMSVRPSAKYPLRPLNANWYAGADPWDSIYGGPLRLAGTARRFDLSPAWLNWVATAPALELLDEVGVDAIHAHNCRLAELAARRLGTEDPGSAIVTLPTPRGAEATARQLAGSGVAAAIRAGGVRVSFHLYNTEADVDALIGAIGS